MKRKYLVWIISVVVILGFSGLASAAGTKMTVVTDTLDDELVDGCDIKSAGVIVYPESSIQAGVKAADYIKISLHMNPASTPASTLPGLIYFEFDVDNDPDTGEVLGMPNIFKACESGSLIKSYTPGIDIAIALVLREQGANTAMAWCYECFGTGINCFLKDTQCDVSCGTSNCYRTEISCNPVTGPFPCWRGDEKCQPSLSLCDKCFELVEECAYDTSCGIGRILGEWYARSTVASSGGSGAPAERGRLEPLPNGTGAAADDCYTFPWARIVQAAHDAGGDFNFANATNPANLRWQVSVWKDVDYTTTENDFMYLSTIPGATCLEISDVIPDGPDPLMLPAQKGNDPCTSDLNNSGSVDGVDTNLYKAGYGRSDFKYACPICK